jgi:phospholipid transport system substrate-binding protein
MARAAAALVAAALVALASCPPVWAGAPTDTLRDTFKAVNTALDDAELRKTPTDLRAAIRKALLPRIDAREAAQLALGDEWMARTRAEREEFAGLFGEHFERTYVFRISVHAPMHRALAIRYVDEKSDGRTATVATALGNREGGEVPVEYRLIQRDGRWAIFDVAIDGASLVDNYRTLFSRVMGQSSYSDVVALMKPRPAEARAANPPSTKAPEPQLASSPATAAASTPTPATPSPARAAVTRTPSVVAPAPITAAPAPTVAPSTALAPKPVALAATPAPAAAAPAPTVATPAPVPTTLPLVAPAPDPAVLTSPAPRPAPVAAAPPAPAPRPAAATTPPVMTPPSPKLSKLVADHAARAAEATTEATKPPAPVPTIAYWLQVGAFKNADSAGGLAARLRARKLPVSIDSVTVPPGSGSAPLSRVRVGPFADQSEAAAKLRELETSGYRPFLAVERTSN